MLNDGVPPTPRSRKLLGAANQSQRLLINFESVMGEHSVAAWTTKDSEKGRPNGTPKCPNSIAGVHAGDMPDASRVNSSAPCKGGRAIASSPYAVRRPNKRFDALSMLR